MSEKTKSTGGIVLADKGRTGYAIAVAANATPPEIRAAYELQRFLEESTGAHFLIVDDAGKPGPREIMVGASRHTAEFGPGTVPTGLGMEEFVVKTVGDHLVIAGGRPRGTLHGVYWFLEHYAGCRWFTAKVSRIPKNDRLAIPPIDVRNKPALEYREPFFREGFDGDWAVRNLMNSANASLTPLHGGKVKYGTFVHTFETLLPSATHFDEHPEWYSEINGQRLKDHTQFCLTNEEVLARTIEGVRGWIRDMPDATIFSVSQNDWTNWCTCPKCKAIDDREGGQIGTILEFVNKVAQAIEKEAPHVAIDTLAYWYSRKPPKTLKPRPNVIVRLCSIECCFAHPLESECEANRKFADDIREWSHIANRLYVWDYVTNFHNYIMPWPNFGVLGPNVRFFVKHNVRGLFEQGSYATGGGGEAAEMRSYVLAKLLYDQNIDERKVRDEFIDGVYGKAAPYVRRYHDLIHEPTKNPDIHMHIFCDVTNPHLTADIIDRSEALLSEAEAAAESPAVRERVELAHLPIHYARIRTMDKDDPARKALLDTFLAIANREGIEYVSEQHRVDTWVEKGAGEPGKW